MIMDVIWAYNPFHDMQGFIASRSLYAPVLSFSEKI